METSWLHSSCDSHVPLHITTEQNICLANLGCGKICVISGIGFWSDYNQVKLHVAVAREGGNPEPDV